MISEHGTPQDKEVKLNDLYQEVILDHNRNPRNFGRLEAADACAHGHNPLCGDEYRVYLKKRPDGAIEKITFEGQGCAISKASASMMTVTLAGKNEKEAAALKDDFIRLLTAEGAGEAVRSRLGRLRIFEGVKNFPIRVKCATLGWRALEAAMKAGGGEAAPVSTE